MMLSEFAPPSSPSKALILMWPESSGELMARAAAVGEVPPYRFSGLILADDDVMRPALSLTTLGLIVTRCLSLPDKRLGPRLGLFEQLLRRQPCNIRLG